LAYLLDLEPGWNSYNAAEIKPSAVIAALRLLWEAMPRGGPVPSIVPSSRGGVQLEWHTRGIELEVSFEPEGSYYVYFEDLRTQSVRETELDSDLGLVTEALSDLTHRPD
jgi:hypothetical protein